MSRYAIITREFLFQVHHDSSKQVGTRQHSHEHSHRLQISFRCPLIEEKGQPDEQGLDDLFLIINTMQFNRLSDSVIGRCHAQPVEQGGMDHHNQSAHSSLCPATANWIHWIWDALVAGGIADHLLYRIRLWETETECTEITHTERETDAVTYKGFE